MSSVPESYCGTARQDLTSFYTNYLLFRLNSLLEHFNTDIHFLSVFSPWMERNLQNFIAKADFIAAPKVNALEID
jgi:hypothetical protein